MLSAGQTVFVPPPLVMPPPIMMAPVPVVQPAVQFVPIATTMGTQSTGHLIANTNSQISGLWRSQETIERLSMSGQDQSSNSTPPGNPSSPSAPGGIGGGNRKGNASEAIRIILNPVLRVEGDPQLGELAPIETHIFYNLEVRQSALGPGVGRGVFALESIRKGVDVIKHLKSKGIKEIHLCSGFADDPDIRTAALTAGATSVIGKI